jgi:hypothetical protein
MHTARTNTDSYTFILQAPNQVAIYAYCTHQPSHVTNRTGIYSIFKKKYVEGSTCYINYLDVQENVTSKQKKKSYNKIRNLRHDNFTRNHKQMFYKGKINITYTKGSNVFVYFTSYLTSSALFRRHESFLTDAHPFH